MEKSFSKVRPAIVEKWDGSKSVVRFNIVEVPDGDDGVKYEYYEVLVSEVSRKAIIEAIIRTTYSESDEIALAFGREADVEKKAAHEEFVAQAKVWADEILGNE